MFPWESAYTGQEVCPSWAPTGQLEQHITGDIAFAFQQYWRLTKDVNWLKKAWPLIAGIAKFWTSRVSFNAQTNQYEINGVIPPDEYAVNVNNSVYTNVAAKISLNFATSVGDILGFQTPQKWKDISSALKTPEDPNQNIFLEFDGYAGQLIKQADVVLLGFPFEYPMSSDRRRSDLQYYSSRSDKVGGPAMTWAMHVIAWLELGEPVLAEQQWPMSYENAREPFGVWTEVANGDGAVNFITGAGGFLQALLFGYGGIRLNDGDMSFNPTPPPNCSVINFGRLHYLGNDFALNVDSAYVAITLLKAGTPLQVSFGQGQSIPLQVDTPVQFVPVPFKLTALPK
jgi:trehalose/maltose hydrolase-like predicted phosphorylase